MFSYMRDTFMEFSRKVIIGVSPHRIARYVKIVLYFDARWIMISEVKFDSGTSRNCFFQCLTKSTVAAFCYHLFMFG